MIAIWNKTSAAGGAVCTQILHTPSTSAASKQIVTVGVVHSPRPVVFTPPYGAPAAGTTTLTAVVSLPNDATCSFLPDVTTLYNPRVAAEAQAVTHWLTGDDVRRVVLTGTTARWGARTGQATTSDQRAAVISALLTN